ncbi:alpha/beta hydrolase [Fulvimonas sp. R45]|uniref:alpha/beta fold hydrolase n=1 Tax=Fulvimonas sp. R45 TaxID=3045937 RepID=UPI00265EED5F|nr:alpha/beta hydrolase [Fulvimonas sp. R45]MDO1527670.1 alpha/beta hydrolase [Fulvimonas sp. R45]
MEDFAARYSTFRTADGLALAVETRHAHGAPGVLFAHGFGQTRGAWGGAAAVLAAQGCRCVGFDARGHGGSDYLPGGAYHMQQFVDDLLGLARAQPAPPVLVGASMGGLLGLVAAGEARPAPFRALVLVDITPRWETRGVERILAFMQAHPDGFADYAEAAARIAAYLPHRAGRKSGEQLRPLLREGADGRLRWHWDPALLAGDLVQESERYQPRLLAAAAQVEVPVLLLSGERSDVVSRATIDEFLALVPQARHVAVAGATHIVAGDANDAFTREIARFTQSLDGADALDARIA